jgi:hypothetical protein
LTKISRTPRFALAAAALSVAVLALVPTAFAGKGGGGGKPSGGSGSLSLSLVTDSNSNGVPNVGDTVTFKASTTATTEPHVRLQCFQGGTLVYSAQAGFYASYPWPWLEDMTLNWSSGAADCTAQIYYFAGSKTVWATSLNFHVDA